MFVGTTELLVDGAPVPPDHGNEFALDPGVHSFEARAPGFEPARTNGTFSAGDQAEIELDVRVPIAVAPPPPEPAPLMEEPTGEPLTSQWWFWGGVAAVAAGTVVALAVSASGSSGPRVEDGSLGRVVEALAR